MSESLEPRSRGTLPILFSVVVVDLIGFGIVLPILPFLARDYDASGTVLGALLTSYAVMQFVCAPLWGRLSDRIGRRPVMLLTIAGTSLSLLWLGLADSIEALFAARLLAGAFAANVSVASAYVTDVTSEEERTTWLGMIGASFGVGFLLGPALGGWLAPQGHGVPMLFAAGLAAINLAWGFVVLREPASHRSPDRGGATPRQILRDPRVRRICLSYFVFSVAVSQLETVFAFFMLERFGYDARGVAWILVLMAAIMVALQGGGLRVLVPRFGEQRLLVAGSALLCLSFFAVPWMPTVAILLLPLAVSSVGRGVAQPALMGLVSFGASPANRGAVMGTFQSSASLARIVGPAIAGVAYDVGAALPFLVASALMAVVVGLAATSTRGVSPQAGVGSAS